MTDAQTLLQLAARCRRMAERCTTAAIARKFEALAIDYEEQARRLSRPGYAANESLSAAVPSADRRAGVLK
jgi:hypothetical protein